ncbi:hypothetical protein TNIN_71631 [Trichonephila inaurata madagascariensis]|uniref:Uncharacterized protein n=1 Tax=Trichonephila inaurata madagascariensis TaxID=2747483 RepID=A0A8X6XPH2_9ARAC|nr:hypothetical protein TNIN_71631 [Trichonephila inaurata madagascariensis]
MAIVKERRCAPTKYTCFPHGLKAERSQVALGMTQWGRRTPLEVYLPFLQGLIYDLPLGKKVRHWVFFRLRRIGFCSGSSPVQGGDWNVPTKK